MSTDTTASPPEERTYGNWQRPESAGLYGMSTTGTILAGIAVILPVLLVLFHQMIPAVVVGLFSAILLGAVMLKDPRTGRPVTQNGVTRSKWFTHSRTGSNLLRQGALTPLADCKLPGTLASLEVTEHLDRSGNPFALIGARSGHYTVPFEARPEGVTGADRSEVNQLVFDYHQFLANLGKIKGIESASVIIRTAPDTGMSLKQIIDTEIKADAHPLAQNVMQEISTTYRHGSASIRAFATVTVKGSARMKALPRDRAERADKIATSLLPEIGPLCADLAASGGNRVTPMDVDRLCEVVRGAYDPDAIPAMEEAHANGRPWTIGWNQVGPSSSQAFWDRYVHDGGCSVTAVMSVPPEGNVHASVLTRLLEPTVELNSKAVAIVYRPHPVEKVAKVADKGMNNASFNLNSATRKTAALQKRKLMAEQTATEVVTGAGLSDFAIVVTGTVRDSSKAQDARDALRILAASSSLQIRFTDGWHDGAFPTTLPLGHLPDRHVKAPSLIKKGVL